VHPTPSPDSCCGQPRDSRTGGSGSRRSSTNSASCPDRSPRPASPPGRLPHGDYSYEVKCFSRDRLDGGQAPGPQPPRLEHTDRLPELAALQTGLVLEANSSPSPRRPAEFPSARPARAARPLADPVTLMIFDVLRVEARTPTSLPYGDRRVLLEARPGRPSNQGRAVRDNVRRERAAPKAWACRRREPDGSTERRIPRR
jgi:hypothetical protein